MSYKTNLELAYHMGYEDALVCNLPDMDKVAVLNEDMCHADETERISISWQDGRHLTIHVMECSECGRTYEHVNGSYEFCPHCGRRITEVEE